MAVSRIINSDDHIPIDNSFKVFAGPGAGKTHWLSLHIKHVIAKSSRLETIRQIACISYTNVGADTIRERLPFATSCVEIATIHSFLYAHVVKPFLHLDAEKYGVDIEKLRVVATESFATAGFAHEVQRACNCEWLPVERVVEGLKGCYWHYDKGAYTYYGPRHSIKFRSANGKQYSVPSKLYQSYLKLMWANGYISYDDVLYFAVELVKNHPELINIIVARFPYFFIDEFQDSIPPIVDFIQMLGAKGATIGVIGDKAQTIYDFIGASVDQFDSFVTPEMAEYEIRGNRRSSPQIVNLLNVIRPDFVQTSIGVSDDITPILIVGDKLDAYQHVTEITKSEDIHTLAYKNIVANSMKYRTTENLPDEKLIDLDFDRNYKRAMVVRNLIKAIEYANVNDLSEAWRQLDVLYSDRREAIIDLRFLLRMRQDLLQLNLMEFLRFIKHNIASTMPLPKANTESRAFYEKYRFIDLALSMKVSDCTSAHKTIHKAKGEEFDNVLLVLGSEKDISILTAPDLAKNSTHRVYYVGMSRAKRKLFLTVDKLSLEDERKLASHPIEVIRL